MGIDSISSGFTGNSAYADGAAGWRLRAESGSASTVAASNTVSNTAANPAAASRTKTKEKADLSPAQLTQLGKLQARDREVRQHEAAHLAASGGLATSGASFTYQKGPDGVNYAIAGEVGINTSPGRTPQDTIQRARTILAAALAPADPSGPDRAVAAAARQMEMQARAELPSQAAQSAEKSTDLQVQDKTAGTTIDGDANINSQLQSAAKTGESSDTGRINPNSDQSSRVIRAYQNTESIASRINLYA
ncbi:MAG: putative metalloprotease CJM1_0395 family protein [Pseudomonadota bacterium]